MIQKDNPYLVKCLLFVEQKFNAGSADGYTDKEYKALSDDIYATTGVLISALTLKRLYGRIQTSGGYSPQEATKDALSKYIGFNNWNHFVNTEFSNQSTRGLSAINKKSRLTLLKALLYGLLAILVLLGIFFIRSSYLTPFRILFNADKNIGKAPHTAVFSYDISGLSSDSIFIDWDDTQRFLLRKMKDTIRHGYLIPYYFNVRLCEKQKVLATTFVHVLSPAWETRISYQPFEPTIITLAAPADSVLYAAPHLVESSGLDKTKGFYGLDYRYFYDFAVNADEMIFTSRVKNSEHTGGLFCMDIGFNLVCEFNEVRFTFYKPGCEAGPLCKISDREISGMFTDLTQFNLGFNNWRTVSFMTAAKRGSVIVDGDTIFSTDYTNSLGKLKGIIFFTMGSGMIDMVSIAGADGRMVYREDFSAH